MSLLLPKRRILILLLLLCFVLILLSSYSDSREEKVNISQARDVVISKDYQEEEADKNVDTYVFIDSSDEEPTDAWKEWGILVDIISTVEQKDHMIARFEVKKHNEGQKHSASSNGIVCLATQSTVSFLHHIVEVSHNWKAPMSVALYVPGLEFVRAKILLWLLYRCSDIASSKIVFRFVYPMNAPPIDMPDLWKGIDSSSCGNIERVMKSLNTSKEILKYPQNFMRNIARESCDTRFSILADNDMIPSPGLAQNLQSVLREQESCDQCAFVIPVYEIAKAVKNLPQNKKELLRMIKQNLARPFHWKAWKPNQSSHHPYVWEKLPTTKQLHVAYPITKYYLYYEPVYAVKQNVTRFDERFIGYGFTRNSQVFQMVVEGYRFYVLDPAFFMHRGFKRYNSNPKWRDHENYKNLNFFFEFASKHLKVRGYGKAVERLKYLKNNRKKRELLGKIVESIDNFGPKRSPSEKLIESLKITTDTSG